VILHLAFHDLDEVDKALKKAKPKNKRFKTFPLS